VQLGQLRGRGRPARRKPCADYADRSRDVIRNKTSSDDGLDRDISRNEVLSAFKPYLRPSCHTKRSTALLASVLRRTNFGFAVCSDAAGCQGGTAPSPALKRFRMIAGLVFSKALALPEKKRGSLFKVGQLRLKGANSEPESRVARSIPMRGERSRGWSPIPPIRRRPRSASQHASRRPRSY